MMMHMLTASHWYFCYRYEHCNE